MAHPRAQLAAPGTHGATGADQELGEEETQVWSRNNAEVLS